MQAHSFLKKERNRKGITPVVSVILLLLVTISVVGFALVFFQRTAQTAGEAGEEQVQQFSSGIESFDIIGVSGNKVYVRNNGAGTLANVKFYVDGTDVQTAAPVSIAPGATSEVALDTGQLAMVPGEKLSVASAGGRQEIEANFYSGNTVAYWKFDGTDGRTINDDSGNGNNGQFQGEAWNDGTLKDENAGNSDGNTPPKVAPGKFGNALSFDGVDDDVDAGNGDALELKLRDKFTLEAWIKPSVLGTRQAIMGNWGGGNCGGGGYGGVNLNIETDKRLWIRWGDTSGNPQSVYGPTLVEGEWQHVALVFDSAGGKIYLNGVATSTGTIPAACRGTWGSFRIGRDQNNAFFFNGIIDEVRVYDRVLTQQEILDNMNSAYPVNRTVASYSFESGAKDTHNVVKGKYGSAISFDGIDDYVSVPDSSKWDFGGNSFAVEAWAYMNEDQSRGEIRDLVNYGGGGGGWDVSNGGISWSFFQYNSDDKLYFEWSTGGTNHATHKSTNALSLAFDWHHFVVSQDAGANSLTLYVDGVNVGQTTAKTITDVTTGTPQLNIGGDRGLYVFNGTIDEVRILNSAI